MITISYELSDDDAEVIMDVEPEGVTVMEGAGMLAMAMDTWLRTNGLRDAGDLDQ